jgi:hypothetical protein
LNCGNFTALGEQGDDAGKVLIGDRLGHARIERCEAFGGEAERCRISDCGDGPGRIVGRLGGDWRGGWFGRRLAGLLSLQAARNCEGCGRQQQPRSHHQWAFGHLFPFTPPALGPVGSGGQ